jgi:outer membrane biosynthesis protein TonB
MLSRPLFFNFKTKAGFLFALLIMYLAVGLACSQKEERRETAPFPGSDVKEEIRAVIKAHIKEMQACYEEGLKDNPKIYGKLVLQWAINPAGKVDSVKVKSSTLESTGIEDCAMAHLKKWVFPKSPKNEVRDVSFPFIFQAQED